MSDAIYYSSLTVVLSPLIASFIAGVFGKAVGVKGAHRITILGMLASFVAALYLAHAILIAQQGPFNFTLYTWATSGAFHFKVGFMLDHLTAVMMIVVTFVSLLVHIYSIGYMDKDPGYQRFFSYISMFTFAMLMLVMANNFLQLFFGWEGVGLASYLLIGFWYDRETANTGSMKAFIVNRVGDFGFILAIAAILDTFGTLDYTSIFAHAQLLTATSIHAFPGVTWPLVTAVCLLLFVGAMGKSAQVPLHVWLPESMEGPTPISALIHAATMVTAGVFMVARMSPLFELSPTALSVVLIIGATGALFTGLIAIVQFDIKRVVAYSTLSQLGYMMAALGASAYAAGIFHLMTHAAFKALLFLGAGSVIIAMHHDQDMRNMGGLRKYMPITYVTFLIGCLALAAIPPFAGFYSKDAIIEAVQLSNITGSTYAYIAVLTGSFVTGLYTFRAFFMTFHGKERMDNETKSHLKESPWTVWLPLVLLAIPSVFAGFYLIKPMLFAKHSLLGKSLFILPGNNVLVELGKEFHGAWAMTLHAVTGLPFWFAFGGVFTAWLCYQRYPQIPGVLAQRYALLHRILINKYGFDDFNQKVFVDGTRRLGEFLYRISDLVFIDGFFVNGSGRAVQRVSAVAKRLQTGYLYDYAFAMILGILGLLIWLLF